MIQIKKTILTLVALIAVTTGVWAADVLNIVVSGTSATIKYDGNASNNPYLSGSGWEQSGDYWDMSYEIRPTITTVTIDGSCKNFSGTSLNSLFSNFSGLTTINGLENLNTANVQNMEYMFDGCSSLTSLDLSSFNTASVTTMALMFSGCSKLTSLDLSSWNTENVEMTYSMFAECSELTTVDLSGWNTANVRNTNYMFGKCPKLENIYVGDGWSTVAVTTSNNMFKDCTKLLSMNTDNPATDKTNAHTGDGGYLKVKPVPAGPEVTQVPNTTDEWQFTMPGGNVELEPEYYPQATVADGGVTAADADARATTDDPLVKVDATKLTGAKKLMYFVSNSGTTAPAYDAEGWTDQLPTAEGFTQQGIVYVWYYPVGTDEGVDGATATYSDGDICLQSITARIADAPTYAVTFAEGTDANEWKAEPAAGVTKGTEVTVTYTGTKKVIGVKAVKKAAGPVAYTQCPDDHHPHWIDLGLPSGTLWQCCNEEATAPEGYGNYYNYAEALSHNAPTKDQIDELLANTTSEWTTLNDVNGRWFTSKTNSGKVFLPAAGYRSNGGLNSAGSIGYYWSSTEQTENYAYGMNFNYGILGCYSNGRNDEQSVRPVR